MSEQEKCPRNGGNIDFHCPAKGRSDLVGNNYGEILCLRCEAEYLRRRLSAGEKRETELQDLVEEMCKYIQYMPTFSQHSADWANRLVIPLLIPMTKYLETSSFKTMLYSSTEYLPKYATQYVPCRCIPESTKYVWLRIVPHDPKLLNPRTN